MFIGQAGVHGLSSPSPLGSGSSFFSTIVFDLYFATCLSKLFLTSKHANQTRGTMKGLAVISTFFFAATTVAATMQADSQVESHVEKRQVCGPILLVR